MVALLAACAFSPREEDIRAQVLEMLHLRGPNGSDRLSQILFAAVSARHWPEKALWDVESPRGTTMGFEELRAT